MKSLPALQPRSHREGGSGRLDQCFISVSQQPASRPLPPPPPPPTTTPPPPPSPPSRSIAVWRCGPGEEPPALNHSHAVFTERPAVSAICNSTDTHIWLQRKAEEQTVDSVRFQSLCTHPRLHMTASLKASFHHPSILLSY